MIMNARENIANKNRIVVKIGTSTLSYENGKLNYSRLEKIAMILSDLQNSGKDIVVVSSGAVGVGAGRLKMQEPPEGLVPRQALAAIGQAELIKIYQKFFDEYNQMVAQVLLTRDGLDDETRRNNARNTLNELLTMKIIPIVNENDTVSTSEIQFGDNDNLSAKVAVLMEADLLIILSDVDGLYAADPLKNTGAKIISAIRNGDNHLERYIFDSSSAFGKGGMVTKIQAAKLCMAEGIDVGLINGTDPVNIQRIMCGKDVGTLFISK